MVALAKLQPNMWSESVQVKRGDIFQVGRHRLCCGDATRADEVARLLDGNACDLIFADPPYGIGIDEWDIAIEDVIGFIGLITSHLKQGGFFAFTHQMPYMVDWLYTLKHSRLKYKDHIAWVKRNLTGIAQQLLRNHESLFIYSKGQVSYYTTKGRYEDVKLPGVLVDTISLEGIDRYIKDLRIKANGGTPMNGDDVLESHFSSYSYMSDAKSDRSPEFANFTNVWSFLPENKRTLGKRNKVHATAKPILLLERLLTLCTPENALVYDAFLGSGTTLISAENTGRRCYGMELSPEYCASIIERWQETTGQQAHLLNPWEVHP